MKNERLKKYITKLRSKYRLVILNDSTYAEVFSVRLSRMNVFAYLGFFSFLLIALVIILMAFTPLREYIPGYPDANMRHNIVQNVILLDSLKNELNVKDQYVQNIRNIIIGEETYHPQQTIDTTVDFGQIKFKRSQDDSMLRHEIEKENKFNVVLNTPVSPAKSIEKLHFFSPLNGVKTNFFNSLQGHYGIDIVSKPNEAILAVLKGTVILATWTIETGYVIEIQHQNDLISVYKHNSQLLKSEGDLVDAGEAVAIVGNTGELSTGPHLHFELWYKGKPVNPEDFIIF